MPRKVDAKMGLLVHVGCRDMKEPLWVGIDWKQHPGVDIVHDLEKFPYPIQSGSCITIKATHVAEHISPKLFFKWMDELWRMLKPDGQLVLSAPYAGSLAYWADPTHVTGITEITLQHLDPDLPMYHVYAPKPWNIKHADWNPTGLINAILQKKPEDDVNELLAKDCLKHNALQKFSELTDLLALIRGRQLNTVVEIGTSNGGVFYGLCKLAAPTATLVSIDLPGGPFGGVMWIDGNKALKSYGKPKQRLEFLRHDSHRESTLKKLKGILGDKKIDLLFIDGDHTYEGIKKDYDMYAPLVGKGGLIVFHDICDHVTQPLVQVRKFWKEIKKGKNTKELLATEDKEWGGIGVIFK